ncbi:hypothetical protein [Pseudoxanthomonas japonensis]|uniref:hypothetical protein n=1 Tax=Pseudoxanthomonas japonensis TaxID=69284 RepID=UPI001BCBE6C3|nr:hypothetical protein [Pseudoxanthomonas japonensis]NCT70891.1 hypothetical protein [Xanthomonadaceae bacterium]
MAKRWEGVAKNKGNGHALFWVVTADKCTKKGIIREGSVNPVHVNQWLAGDSGLARRLLYIRTFLSNPRFRDVPGER